MSAEKYYSRLDSERFGIKVAKINDYGKDPDGILNELKGSDYQLVLSKIEAHDIELLNKLENFGFRIKDGQVTYKYDMSKFDMNILKYIKDPSVVLRPQNNDDIDQIVKLTEKSFYDYGHYAADNKLDKSKCRDIYTDWAYRSCTDRNVADKVFVAEIEGEIAGYLAFKNFGTGENIHTAGVLGAVSEKFRGKDIFRKVTVKALEWGLEEKFAWEEHNVLINNYPVNRSFSKLGFVVFKSFYTLHCWL